MKSEPVQVTAVWLVREADEVVVYVEIDGHWFEAIREHAEGCYSHIAEAWSFDYRKKPVRMFAPSFPPERNSK